MTRLLAPLLLLLVAFAPAHAQGGWYSAHGVKFQLPLPFSGAEPTPMTAVSFWYPVGNPLDTELRLTVDRLGADKASEAQRFFEEDFRLFCAQTGSYQTGATRTFLGQAVPEAAGQPSQIDGGTARAWLVPLPDGGSLFVGLRISSQADPDQAEAVLRSLSSTLAVTGPDEDDDLPALP